MKLLEHLLQVIQRSLAPGNPVRPQPANRFELHINDRITRVNRTLPFDSFRELNDYVWRHNLMADPEKQVLVIQRNSWPQHDYVLSLTFSNMISIPSFSFNHQADNFLDAVGLQKEHQRMITYSTLYHFLSPLVLTNTNSSDLSAEEDCKSLVFERVYNQVKENPAQVALLMYMFQSVYEQIAQDAVKSIQILSKKKTSLETDQDPFMMMTSLSRLLPLIGLIRIIRNQKPTYEEFMALVSSEQQFIELDNPDMKEKDYSEIDEMLKNILEKEE